MGKYSAVIGDNALPSVHKTWEAATALDTATAYAHPQTVIGTAPSFSQTLEEDLPLSLNRAKIVRHTFIVTVTLEVGGG